MATRQQSEENPAQNQVIAVFSGIDLPEERIDASACVSQAASPAVTGLRP
jgi:hypothetical protein